MKCENCNLKKIRKIFFYDFIIQKCPSCEYVRLFIDDFELLKYQALYLKNIGNIKKHEELLLYSELNKKYIEDFLKLFSSNVKRVDSDNKVCDVCKEKLKKVIVNKFTYYECNYCTSIYFLQNDFENFINEGIKQIYRKNYMFKIIFIIKNYYKNIKIRIKEIFHRKVKNNVKK